MRVSQLFLQTLRTAPGDVHLPGFGFLLRAGLARPLPGGGFGFTALGLAARRRATRLVSDGLLQIGAQEVALPASGLRVLADFARGAVQSYRQLPMLLWQIWDGSHAASSGAYGLLGVTEGQCVEAYGLEAAEEAAEATRDRLQVLVLGALEAARVPVVEAIATEEACHWLFALPGGPDRVLRCDGCGYSADHAIAPLRGSVSDTAHEQLLPVEPVATPACKTIAELATYLRIPESRTAKAIFLVDESSEGNRGFVLAVVRGDTDLSEAKLMRVLEAGRLAPATEAEIRRAGAVPGYGSPVGLQGLPPTLPVAMEDASGGRPAGRSLEPRAWPAGLKVVVDGLVARSPNLVAGANREGYHLRNVNYGRDFSGTVADIALAQEGDPCPSCGSALRAWSGVELARVGLAGKPFGTYLDSDGRPQPLLVPWCRFHVDRFLAAVAESHHDEHGLLWPATIAPCDVYLMTAGKLVPEVRAAADRLYDALSATGLSVLYDDRDERAGVKFNDADLIGAPWRIAVGERGLRDGVVELKRRGGEVVSLPADEVVARLARHPGI